MPTLPSAATLTRSVPAVTKFIAPVVGRLIPVVVSFVKEKDGEDRAPPRDLTCPVPVI